MTQPENPLEPRVAALESDVAELKEQSARSARDAEAARTLAAGADQDVSEVRAELRSHVRVLNALRETQLEHTQVLHEHTQILQEHAQLLTEQRQAIVETRELLGVTRRDVQVGFGVVQRDVGRILTLLEQGD